MARRKGFGFSINLDKSNFEKGLKDAKKALDSFFGAEIMSISSAATVSLAGFTSAIAGVTAAAYKFGAQMDVMKTALQGTWGSAQKATEQYKKLQEIVENTNYNMSQLMGLDKTMKALGYDADNSAKAVKRLVNAGIANPQASLQGFADALLQIKTSGQVSAKALKQFADAGIDVSDLIGKDATTAIDTLMDRMQKFNGYMESESVDIWQQIHRYMEITKDAAGELGLYINEKLHPYFVAFGNGLSQLRDKLANLLKKDGKGIYDLIDAVAAIGVAITTVALPRLASLSLAMAPLAVKIGLVTAAVIGLAEVFKAAFRKDGALGTALVEFFKWIYNEVVKVLARIGEKVTNWVMRLAHEAGFDKMANAISKIGSEIASTYYDASKAADQAYEKLAKSAEKIKNESITNGIVNTVKEIADAFNGGNTKHEIIVKSGDGNSSVLKRDSSGDAAKESITSYSPKKYNLGYGPNGMMEYALGVGYDQMKSASSAPWVQELMEWKKNLLEYEKSIDELKEKWINAKISLVESFSNGLNEALWASGNFFQNIGKFFKDFGKQIIQQVTQLMLMTSLLRMFGYHYDVQGLSLGNIMSMSDYQKTINPPSIGDGIVQNGKIIGTDPEDTIIAMKHPENLNGGANVVVNVNNNTQAQVTTNSYFDGTREIIDIVIDGLNRNVSGFRDMVRSV